MNEASEKRILYIEDNEENIYMLTLRLTRKGFNVSIAKDGQEGIDKAKLELPNLILCDVGLPIIDGYGVTKALKSDPLTKDIPIIVLTAHAMIEDKTKAFEAGANNYETKPIVMDELLRKIIELLL